jgi:hypothetical protein
MRMMIDLIADEYENARIIKSPEEMVVWLRESHTHLAKRLHNGEDVMDLIPE